jgi:hypothetical protein
VDRVVEARVGADRRMLGRGDVARREPVDRAAGDGRDDLGGRDAAEKAAVGDDEGAPHVRPAQELRHLLDRGAPVDDSGIGDESVTDHHRLRDSAAKGARAESIPLRSAQARRRARARLAP